jgi:hypothetical protein
MRRVRTAALAFSFVAMVTVLLPAAAGDLAARPVLRVCLRFFRIERRFGIFVRRAWPAVPDAGGRLFGRGHALYSTILLITLIMRILLRVSLLTLLVGVGLARTFGSIGGGRFIVTGTVVAAIGRRYRRWSFAH